MRFGPLPLDEAEGAILAHSLRLPGTSLAKGHVLGAADIAALRAAGLSRVVAAKLDPEDVGEDAAAERIAAAVAGPGVTLSKASTGRVNLMAAEAGVLALDVRRLNRLNRIDEAITIATLAPFAAVAPRQMVATIKIIPFAVPEPLVAQATAIAAEAPPLVRVAAFRPLRAALLQTHLPGTKDSVLTKTTAVTRDRLAALGGTLVEERRTVHDEAAVAAALAELHRPEVDLLLIIGASAITDRHDVLPAAIQRVGGTVEHFGMPVDPGNLLLLARLEATPVLGLPGCARSPKLNGMDWVLQRLAAGIPVTRDDIMGMGVGGLLMEIPTRPLPRAAAVAGRAEERPPRVAALVLAAGQSRRMAPSNKLLEPVAGAPMVRRVVDAVLASRARPVIVVTGHQANAVGAALGDRPVHIVHNPLYAEGLSTSLKAGLAALPEDVDAVVVCLGDMPRITPAVIDRLMAAYVPHAGRTICVPTVAGRRGNPVLWDRRFFPEMMMLSGDIGARHLIAAHADAVAEVPMDDDAVLFDVYTPEGLSALGRETS